YAAESIIRPPRVAPRLRARNYVAAVNSSPAPKRSLTSPPAAVAGHRVARLQWPCGNPPVPEHCLMELPPGIPRGTPWIVAIWRSAPSTTPHEPLRPRIPGECQGRRGGARRYFYDKH